MYRLLKTLFLLPWLSACAPMWPTGGMSPDWNGGLRAGASHDFNWRLSGDRQVAPLQVFDDGRQTWLHFAAGQAVPAIFVEQNGVAHPAQYLRREPYVIVRGKWPALIMRGGSLQARADYLGGVAQASAMARHEATPTEAPAATVTAVAPASSTAGVAAASATRIMPAASGPAPGAASGAKQVAASGAASGASSSRAASTALSPSTASSAGAAAASGTGSYRVGPADENMRRALTRWAGIAGWTFHPEHWAVDVDIPLSGSADFSDDFKQSVRELLGATELAERPVQPCFYVNRVVRVVPLSQACDRTAARAGAGS